MAKRSSSAPASVAAARGTSSRFTGGTVITQRVPSGVPLLMDVDSEAVLVFLGEKDVTDKVPEKNRREGERVLYLAFHDGRRVVSMPVGYALSEVVWERDKVYYIHNQGNIKMEGRNDMRDLRIELLGSEGSKVTFDGSEIELTLPELRRLNYELVNYPLRTV